jgi:DnaJ-class molecular chaperone
MMKEQTKSCEHCLGTGIRNAVTLENGNKVEHECWACAGKGVVRLDGTAFLEKV